MLRKTVSPTVMTLLVLLAALLQGPPCEAGWFTTYGGTGVDAAYSISQTTDGGYIVAGSTNSSGAGSQDAWVAKLDEDGNVTWQKTYGGADAERVSVQQTADGGYIAAGSTGSFGAGGNGDLWAIKLDADGNVTWQKTYGGAASYEYANSIRQTADGGYIVAGFTRSFGAGNGDMWLLKLDASGNVAWQKTYGGPETETAGYAEQTSDHGYIVAGYTKSFGAGNEDAWILKLDASGNITWQKTYGGAADDGANVVRQTADGGYIVAGHTASSGAGGSDAWILKLDATGNITWQKSYGGIEYDSAYAVQQTTDGGYIVGGGTESFGVGFEDAWLFKLDASGKVTWQKTYGAIDYDAVSSLQQTTDGGYVAAGSTNSLGAGAQDAWVLKLDAHGSTGLCPFEFESTATVSDTAVTGAATTAVPADSAGISSSTSVVPAVSALTASLICPLSSKAPTLSVGATKKHQGDGTITSNDGLINCPGECQTRYKTGSVVTLSAKASGLSTFLGWTPSSLGCLTTDPCHVTMDKRQSVKAIFQGPGKLKTGITPKNKGTGTVKSDGIINCPGTCEESYALGAPVTLTATAETFSTFVKWSGTPCASRTTNVCTFNMDKDYTVKPVFQGPNKLKVGITSRNKGAGTIRSGGDLINCPGDCEEFYALGAPVTLTATAETLSTFVKWSGGPCASRTTNVCTFNMDKNYTVNAIFQGN